ncbi:MAG: hypothetical protein H6817_01360 [Phycisphaerales bacterium]|nr:hypothetical protein [Phycisphaerales bacterium]
MPKTVEIVEVPAFSGSDLDGPYWKQKAIGYLLTLLSDMPQGCIFANPAKSDDTVRWQYSSEPCTTLWPDRVDGEVLVHPRGWFRSILGTLGMFLADELYMGGGTFILRFKGREQESELMGIIFGNTTPTGYWAKLFVIPGVQAMTKQGRSGSPS